MPSQPGDDRSGAEDDVETEPGSWSEVENNSPESDDDAESEQKPLLKKLSELEVCKKGCVDDDDREQEPLPPNRYQPKETESSSDEVDETTRNVLSPPLRSWKPWPLAGLCPKTLDVVASR